MEINNTNLCPAISKNILLSVIIYKCYGGKEMNI